MTVLSLQTHLFLLLMLLGCRNQLLSAWSCDIVWLMQKAATRVHVGVQCDELEKTTAGGLADSSLVAPDHASTEVHVVSGKQLLLLPWGFITAVVMIHVVP